MPTLKALDKEETTLLNLRVTVSEKAELEAKARKYAKGNLSAWLRIAGLSYEPRKSELTK